MQSIDSIETYGYGTSKDLVSKKEEIEFNKKIQKRLKLRLYYKSRQVKKQIGKKFLTIHIDY